VTKATELLQQAKDEGVLGAQSMGALTVVDLGAEIQAGLGICPDDVTASEVVLVTVMPDDSGSISAAGNSQLVRDGHNLVLEALQKSKQRDAILAHCRYLNGSVLYPYRPVEQAEKMTAKNYSPHLGTPLYDQAVVLLGTVIAKTQEFAAAGVPVRTVTLLLTDGGDAHSTRAKAKDVAALVGDMAKTEQHVVAAMGLDDGTTNFRDVFRKMGIEDRWILTPAATASEIRKAFQVFSQSAVKVAQGAVALGGFGR
jgi:hypothetical protein